MKAFLLFNVALIVGSFLILTFVMVWRDIYHEECRKNKSHLLRMESHPFTNLAFYRDILAPFLAVCITSLVFGFEWISLPDQTLNYFAAFMVMGLYCATQYAFFVNMDRFYAR